MYGVTDVGDTTLSLLWSAAGKPEKHLVATQYGNQSTGFGGASAATAIVLKCIQPPKRTFLTKTGALAR
jgi:hypothetical protein